MTYIDAETAKILWNPKLSAKLNATPAYHKGQIFASACYGAGLIAGSFSKIVAIDAGNGKTNWTFPGPGGFTGPVVGNNGYVYSGATTNPYFFAFNEKGNGEGSTNCIFRVKLANRIEEATPALYRGKAYILSSGGYLYAIE
jgi:outer membrane protein assembly factor BamB